MRELIDSVERSTNEKEPEVTYSLPAPVGSSRSCLKVWTTANRLLLPGTQVGVCILRSPELYKLQ